MPKNHTNASRYYEWDNKQPIRPSEPQSGSKVSLVSPIFTFSDKDVFCLLAMWLFEHDQLGKDKRCQSNCAKYYEYPRDNCWLQSSALYIYAARGLTIGVQRMRAALARVAVRLSEC